MKNIPRVMIAGTNSGCGKTTITIGLLAALKQRNIKTASYKCGPDYIDPMFHRTVFDIPTQNLDLFFTSEKQLKYLFSKGFDSQFALIEGVMGFYDGMAMDSTCASSYHLARATDTPVILVVNAKGMALSVVSLIKGFLEYKNDNTIKGVILNNVSIMTGKSLKKIIEDELGIRVFGTVPNMKDFVLESRHLGLVTPYELQNIRADIFKLGETIEQYVDIDSIIELGNLSGPIDDRIPNEWKSYDKYYGRFSDINVGIAFDKAFCFYYRDNIDLLKRLGCNIQYFSPLNDKKLPKNLDIMLIGGGYPELYAKELSGNNSMKDSIKSAVKNGIYVLAECGGFMYLLDNMEGYDSKTYPMTGILKGNSFNCHKLVRFGYMNITKNKENIFLKDDSVIKGHEFHYWDSDNNGNGFTAVKPSGKMKHEICHISDKIVAGYPHLYYYSNIDFVVNFLESCLSYKIGGK